MITTTPGEREDTEQDESPEPPECPYCDRYMVSMGTGRYYCVSCDMSSRDLEDSYYY